MSALAAIIKEPANNLKRWDSEDAAKLYRYADATVLFTSAGSGVSNTVQAGVAAIPWTSGFGSGATPPTTDGTIDLTDYGPWVTFILAGTTGATRQMYVTQLRNWAAVAGPAGGRTVVALDILEFLRTRYAGPELSGDYVLVQSGVYATSGGVAVAASTDATTHGDYGYADIPYGIDYPSGVVPAVTPVSCDRDFVASLDLANTDNHAFRVYVRRVRALTAPVFGSESVHIDGSITPTPTGALNGVDYNGVTFDSAPLVFPSVTDDPGASEFEADYQPSVRNVGTSTFDITLDHLARQVQPFPTAGHTHNVPVPNADYSTGSHTLTAASATDTTSIFTNEVTDRVLTVAWMACGQQSAAATHVSVSWTARG